MSVDNIISLAAQYELLVKNASDAPRAGERGIPADLIVHLDYIFNAAKRSMHEISNDPNFPFDREDYVLNDIEHDIREVRKLYRAK